MEYHQSIIVDDSPLTNNTSSSTLSSISLSPSLFISNFSDQLTSFKIASSSPLLFFTKKSNQKQLIEEKIIKKKCYHLKFFKIYLKYIFLILSLFLFSVQLFNYFIRIEYKKSFSFFILDQENKNLIYYNEKILINNFYLKKNTNIDHLNSSKLRYDSNDIFFDELSSIKTSLNKAYVSVDIQFQNCPLISDKLLGYLDSSLILKQANLSSLIEFYDSKKTNSTTNKAKKNDLFYLNDLEFSNFSMNMSKDDWLLWNSNNMSLINMSSEFYGEDGYRVRTGGFWKPIECVSNFKVAVIIPYRDRLPHLKTLLHYLHMILQRQMLDYRIYVVEPNTPLDTRFNKGRVMNSAFLEAMKQESDIDCFIFHDVDLIPEDDRTMYSCPPKPRHLSVAIDKFDYILPYSYLVGGVFAIRTQHYKLINGYSNMYWGWGGEGKSFKLRKLKF